MLFILFRSFYSTKQNTAYVNNTNVDIYKVLDLQHILIYTMTFNYACTYGIIMLRVFCSVVGNNPSFHFCTEYISTLLISNAYYLSPSYSTACDR